MLTKSLATDFERLLTLVMQLVQSQAGQPIPADQLLLNDAQVLARKFCNHVVSLRLIAQPVEVDIAGYGAARHIDHSSVMILARAALETYLTFAYVYGSKDAQVRQFRHLVWHRAGLLDRQDFPARAAENQQKLADEKAQIDQLQTEIEAHGVWQQYSASERKRMLKGDWHAGQSWGDIGVAAGFHPVYIRNVYSFLCGYAHSSWLSIVQIRDAQALSVQEAMAAKFVSAALVFMSFFAESYVALFPQATAVLTSNPEAANLAKQWYLTADRISAQYGAANG
ncbi:DUF5677 domain-containing protein [Ralstonia pseudosolanacearum]|uniref:DUF5677 domain-containing protein n=1 Tax=Ralstonia pseudosolanacearum TaxID=1310165 RepID=UPI00270244BB|nr:DUF5677 domain-containing protein [Ralstonia pseudosolanacearum]MDO3615282.1 DUF5677 domain-containing protein [Ralstonia pseudosolanacearum]